MLNRQFNPKNVAVSPPILNSPHRSSNSANLNNMASNSMNNEKNASLPLKHPQSNFHDRGSEKVVKRKTPENNQSRDLPVDITHLMPPAKRAALSPLCLHSTNSSPIPPSSIMSHNIIHAPFAPPNTTLPIQSSSILSPITTTQQNQNFSLQLKLDDITMWNDIREKERFMNCMHNLKFKLDLIN